MAFYSAIYISELGLASQEIQMLIMKYTQVLKKNITLYIALFFFKTGTRVRESVQYSIVQTEYPIFNYTMLEC